MAVDVGEVVGLGELGDDQGLAGLGDHVGVGGEGRDGAAAEGGRLAVGRVEAEALGVEQQSFGADDAGPQRDGGDAMRLEFAALAADPNVISKTGEALVVAELAETYDFTDLDGKRPASLRRK